MPSTPELSRNDIFASVIGEIAKAVCARNGELAEQQFVRSQAAVHMVMGFAPRDVIEVLLAGHCIMLHEAMLASARDTLAGETDAMRRSTRSALIAMNREFNSNLCHLERYQARPGPARQDALAMPPAEETAGRTPADAATSSGQPKTVPPAPSAAAQDAPPPPETVGSADATTRNPDPDAAIESDPFPAMLAECEANPEAMAALAAGDPGRFAKALGIAIPDDSFLQAANMPGSPFDPNATGPWAATMNSRRRTG